MHSVGRWVAIAGVAALSLIAVAGFTLVGVVTARVAFERTPSTIRCLAPLLGEHSDEVLAEIGVSDDELASLRKAGVLG